MVTLSLVVIALLFGVYGWLCGVGCGLSLIRLLPHSTLTRHALTFFRPLWEVTNIFLLLGIGGFVLLYHNAWTSVSKVAVPSLIAGGIALALRIALTLWIHYTKARVGPTGRNLLLVIATFAVPLCFGAVGIRLLIGAPFWDKLTGWFLLLSLFVGFVALALGYVYFVVGQTPHGRIRALSRWSNIALFIVTTIGLQNIISHRFSHLLTLPFIYAMLLLSLTIIWQLALWYSARDRYMWWYISAVGIMSPLLFMLANRPYLYFPTIRLQDVYGSSGHPSTVVWTLSVVFPVLLVVTGLLAWNLVRPKTPAKRTT